MKSDALTWFCWRFCWWHACAVETQQICHQPSVRLSYLCASPSVEVVKEDVGKSRPVAKGTFVAPKWLDQNYLSFSRTTMAPAKANTKQHILARHKANASWSSWRSVDAPPKPISELVEDSSATEIFTPIPAQHERQGPSFGVQVVCFYY